MNKIIEYSFVSGSGHVDLWVKVNKAISNGWQPFGSVFYERDINKYLQPVVKYEL